MNIHEKLRSLRLEHGYTQAHLAKFLNIGRTTYTGYETGCINPPVEKLEQLSKLYNVDVEDYEVVSDQLNGSKEEINPNDLELLDLRAMILNKINSHNITFCGRKLNDSDLLLLKNLLEFTFDGIENNSKFKK